MYLLLGREDSLGFRVLGSGTAADELSCVAEVELRRPIQYLGSRPRLLKYRSRKRGSRAGQGTLSSLLLP